MYCKNCGMQMNDNSKFCPRCGKAVESAGQTQQDAYGQDMYNQDGYNQGGYSQSQWQQNQGEQNPWQNPNQPWQWEQTQPEEPQKPLRSKSKLKIIIPVVAGAAVVALGIGGFAMSKTNFFKAKFSSPTSYYRYVEMRSIEETSRRLETAFERSRAMTSLDANIVLEDGGLALFGMSGIDDQSALNDLGELRIQARMGENGELSGQELLLYSGDTCIASANVITDASDGSSYIQVPELSSSYICMDAQSMREMGMTTDPLTTMAELPEVSLMTDIFNRYSGLMLEYATNVTREKEEINVDGIRQNAIRLTVDLDEEQIDSLLEACVDTLEEDEDFREYMLWLMDASGYSMYMEYDTYGYSGDSGLDDDLYDEFLTDMEQAIDALRYDIKEAAGRASMTVWVDSDGNIIGRSMEFATDYGSLELFNYRTARDGNQYAEEYFFGEYGEYMDTAVAVYGSGTIDKDLAEGVYYVEEGSGRELLKVEVSDYDTAKAEDGYLDGTFTFTSTTDPEMAGYGLTVTVSSEDGKQATALSVTSNSVPLGTVNMSISDDSYTPELPKDATVYDVNDSYDMEAYQMECDIEGFLDSLSQNSFLQLYIDSVYGYDDYY